MNVHILNYEPNRMGGGFTAARYLSEGLGNVSYDESDTVLICGPTMVSHEQVEQAKKDGKRIVLRIDNHLLPSRNRNTGMSRMETFADQADLIIYQSKWARDYLSPHLKKDGPIILNGVDTKVFNSKNRTNTDDYLYVRSSRIEEKGWSQARYYYSRQWQQDKDLSLVIVGAFSPENLDYNFDFFQGERYKFMGNQPHEVLAGIYKTCKYFLYSYFMDACSNTLIEARASGCEIVDCYGALDTGGAKEIMECNDISVERMINEYRHAIGSL